MISLLEFTLFRLCLFPYSFAFGFAFTKIPDTTNRLDISFLQWSDNKQHLLDNIDRLLKSDGIFSNEYSESILKQIDQSHFDDIQFCSVFEHEKHIPYIHSADPFQMDEITDKSSPFLPHLSAVTSCNGAILSSKDANIIVSEAQSYWNRPQVNSASSSRFTYQRKGNYEAHLVDLAAYNPKIIEIINESLHNKIYPLVRKEFSEKISDLHCHHLCIYDALVIRYNATEAMLESDRIGAGQPLHRDLGLISVNIMLNPSNHFEGGGTFFENQLLPFGPNISLDNPLPLRPANVGHALLHLSSDRHAGALTTRGIRDILVIFLTARKVVYGIEQIPPAIPAMERSARLKSSARTQCSECPSLTQSILCRILHYRLGIRFSSIDGEAWHYLGMSLRELHKTQLSDTSHRALRDIQSSSLGMSILCLKYAINLIPCDARLYNSFALALETMKEYLQLFQPALSGQQAALQQLHGLIVEAYERSFHLHALSEKVGCDVAMDYDSACLNYGLYLSNLDMFDESTKILKRRFTDIDALNQYRNESPEHQRLRNHGQKLLVFCNEQINGTY